MPHTTVSDRETVSVLEYLRNNSTTSFSNVDTAVSTSEHILFTAIFIYHTHNIYRVMMLCNQILH